MGIIKLFILILTILFIFSFVSAATYQDAVDSINNSNLIMNELRDNGFSIVFINDTILQAEIVLQQAKYAEILRNSNSSSIQQNEARRALVLVDWKNITYDSVLTYATVIEQRKVMAYDIFDSLRSLRDKVDLMEYQKINVSSVLVYLNQANESFYADRYEESLGFIDKTKLEIEKVSSENATLNVLAKNTKNFFYRYWYIILLFLLILGFIVYLVYRRMIRYLLKKRIFKMKTELIVLNKLMISNQEDRFNKNKISALVYNIRAKKYEQRINSIEELLPVLEEKLKDKIKNA